MNLKAGKLQVQKDLCDSLLSGIGNFDHVKEITEKAISDIQKQREKLIFDRLEWLGIPIDIELEQRRRFKSLSMECKGNEETIYYNDGSESGLRVITFVTKQIPFNPEEMSMGYETSYF